MYVWELEERSESQAGSWSTRSLAASEECGLGEFRSSIYERPESIVYACPDYQPVNDSVRLLLATADLCLPLLWWWASRLADGAQFSLFANRGARGR